MQPCRAAAWSRKMTCAAPCRHLPPPQPHPLSSKSPTDRQLALQGLATIQSPREQGPGDRLFAAISLLSGFTPVSFRNPVGASEKCRKLQRARSLGQRPLHSHQLRSGHGPTFFEKARGRAQLVYGKRTREDHNRSIFVDRRTPDHSSQTELTTITRDLVPDTLLEDLGSPRFPESTVFQAPGPILLFTLVPGNHNVQQRIVVFVSVENMQATL
jgi:hypothetical protein